MSDFEEDLDPATIGTFADLLLQGCTVDLTGYYGVTVPVNRLQMLVQAAVEGGGHLKISGSYIHARQLRDMGAIGGRHLTVVFDN